MFDSGMNGLFICDPVSGEMEPAFDFAHMRYDYRENARINTWKHARGQDVGVLPGGWIAVGGGRQFFYPYSCREPGAIYRYF